METDAAEEAAANTNTVRAFRTASINNALPRNRRRGSRCFQSPEEVGDISDKLDDVTCAAQMGNSKEARATERLEIILHITITCLFIIVNISPDELTAANEPENEEESF